ncbi:MAG: DUF697 domain-containing protein [Acetobacterium sp.]|uniref:YcjF family protein n=1 Tax=Acetobacterium sp. TaxID=1872094 RepID=UPI003242CA7C
MGVEFKADAFDYEAEYEKIKNQVVKPNILLCGATGVGKSSLVNDVFGENLAVVGAGEPVTRGTHRYEGETITIFDSEGYEIGSDRQAHYREEIIGWIDRQRREDPEAVEDQIHEVWYCISAANKRITDTDFMLIREIQEKKVPVALVFTQVDGVEAEELEALQQTAREEFSAMALFTYAVTADERVQTLLKPYIQKEALIDWAIGVLPEYLREGLIIALKGCIEKKRDHVTQRVISKYTVAAAGVGASPIPFSDAMVLMPVQMAMTLHIFNVYGLSKLKGTAASLLETQILGQLGKVLAGTLVGNLTKLLPGFGTAAGMIINAGVASAITLTLGLTVSTLCFNYSQAVLAGISVDVDEFFGTDAFNDIFDVAMRRVKNNG